jgi:DNA-binding NarL/FixJ family response regulator
LIGSTPEFEVAAQAGSAAEALSKIREMPIDIAILDVSFHGTNGLELTKQMRRSSQNSGSSCSPCTMSSFTPSGR